MGGEKERILSPPMILNRRIWNGLEGRKFADILFDVCSFLTKHQIEYQQTVGKKRGTNEEDQIIF